MEHELVFTVRLRDGETLRHGDMADLPFSISALPDRDPTVVAFLVSFAAAASLEALLALRQLAGRRSFSLAMRHNGRRLTITTDDEDLNLEHLSRVMKDFYRQE